MPENCIKLIMVKVLKVLMTIASIDVRKTFCALNLKYEKREIKDNYIFFCCEVEVLSVLIIIDISSYCNRVTGRFIKFYFSPNFIFIREVSMSIATLFAPPCGTIISA